MVALSFFRSGGMPSGAQASPSCRLSEPEAYGPEAGRIKQKAAQADLD